MVTKQQTLNLPEQKTVKFRLIITYGNDTENPTAFDEVLLRL